MSGPVREILKQIQALPEPERDELRVELARQEEQEWAKLATEARRIARKRKIDDDSIARTVERSRYGESSGK